MGNVAPVAPITDPLDPIQTPQDPEEQNTDPEKLTTSPPRLTQETAPTELLRESKDLADASLKGTPILPVIPSQTSTAEPVPPDTFNETQTEMTHPLSTSAEKPSITPPEDITTPQPSIENFLQPATVDPILEEEKIITPQPSIENFFENKQIRTPPTDDGADTSSGTSASTSSEQQDQTCDEYLAQMRAQNTFVLSESNRRNIIFIGKSRSGKSTAIDGLRNPYCIAPPPTIFSGTQEPRITHFTVETPNSDGSNELTNYNINIIDTPGLFEVSKEGKERDDETLETLIFQCMNAQITQIHAIFFVISCGSAINPHDIASLSRFIRLFAGAEKFLHVLLTNSEDLDDNSKQNYIRELAAIPKLSEMLSFTTKKFHFSGAIAQHCMTFGSEEMVQLQLAKNLKMRLELFETIFSASEPFPLLKLARTGTIREKAIRLFDSLVVTFNNKPLQNRAQFEKSLNELASKIPIMTTPWAKTMRAFLGEARTYLTIH